MSLDQMEIFILSNSAKWLLSLGMLLGRLELLTVLVLFLPAFLEKLI